MQFYFFFNTSGFNQSLNGLWQGQSERSIFILNPIQTVLELEVHSDSLLSGVIHSYYSKGRYEHVKIRGSINWKDSIAIILEEEEITHNINPKFFEICLGTMQLKLTKTGNIYLLSGKWKDNNRKLFHCPTLNTKFVKQIQHILNSELKDTILKRKTDIQKVIEITPNETDSIKLSIYDNGIIDDDTASVYINDSLLLKSVRLTQTPIELFFSINKNYPVTKLKLVAENLGSIPPNTALIIITTRNKQYSMTLSSDYSQNGSIEFFLKE